MTHGLGGAIALSGMVNPIRTEEATVAATAPSACNVLLVYPRFAGETFWNFAAACEIFGAKYPTSPLGLITVAAMLPSVVEYAAGRPQRRGTRATAISTGPIWS